MVNYLKISVKKNNRTLEKLKKNSECLKIEAMKINVRKWKCKFSECQKMDGKNSGSRKYADKKKFFFKEDFQK